MKSLGSLAILGLVLAAGQFPVRAATATSDWPSFNYDGGQTNYNPVEKTLSAKNLLKLKVRWTAPIASQSYPVVAGGKVFVPFVSGPKIHVRALDASTGRQVAMYPKDALGGMLADNGDLFLAGHVVQAVDPATGSKLVQFNPSPKTQGGVFVYPVADAKVIAVGYYTGSSTKVPNTLYGLDPVSDQILWKAPTLSAQGAIGNGRIITQTATGSQFYDETTGRSVAAQPAVYGNWFWGASLAYTVATVKKTGATLYAYSVSGKPQWKRQVGPYMIAKDWPHALSPENLYVQTFKPQVGVAAMDPLSGKQVWFQRVPDIQRMAVANGVLYVLSYSLGQQTRLIGFDAKSGKSLGAVVLSSGFSAFGAPNGLMVANGMIFIRAVGPGSIPQLVALAPQM